MGNEKISQEQRLTQQGRIHITYRWSLGIHARRFFAFLRDHAQILGISCPRCKNVLVPPLPYCPRCFVETVEWVILPDRGVAKPPILYLLSFPGQAKDPPYVISQILLDGASTPITHMLDEVEDPFHLPAKLRVEAVWRTNRRGSIEDIAYFRPEKRENQ